MAGQAERNGRLRAALDGGLARIMAAHSPLSATLAEEAGFDGAWASGFELSALMGLPDVSLVSMSQHLEMVRAMAWRTNLPVVADIDTGFGNAVNVVHAVRLYEEAGASAVGMSRLAIDRRSTRISMASARLASRLRASSHAA